MQNAEILGKLTEYALTLHQFVDPEFLRAGQTLLADKFCELTSTIKLEDKFKDFTNKKIKPQLDANSILIDCTIGENKKDPSVKGVNINFNASDLNSGDIEYSYKDINLSEDDVMSILYSYNNWLFQESTVSIEGFRDQLADPDFCDDWEDEDEED